MRFLIFAAISVGAVSARNAVVIANGVHNNNNGLKVEDEDVKSNFTDYEAMLDATLSKHYEANKVEGMDPKTEGLRIGTRGDSLNLTKSEDFDLLIFAQNWPVSNCLIWKERDPRSESVLL